MTNLATEQRLEWLRSELESTGAVRIGVAAKTLEVSEMTVRRDLQELESVGVARRVRGGAVATGPAHFAERHRQQARAKSTIADKLLPLVPETGAIGLDSSTTMLRLATAIPGARDLTVVTNSVETFTALKGKKGIQAVLTGGQLEPRTDSLVGPVAVHTAGSFLLRRFFMSVAAVDPTVGPSEAAIEEAHIKQAFARVSEEVVLGADTTKLDSRALAISVSWEQVAHLATELSPQDPHLTAYTPVAELL